MSGNLGNCLAESFAQVVREHLSRLRAGEVAFHLPARWNLHSPRLNATFHATPELFIQTGGATDFVCPGSRFRLNKGDICVMPRGLPHAETPIDLKTPYQVMVIGMSSQQLYLVEGRADASRRIISDPFLFFEHYARPLDLIHYLDEVAEASVLPEAERGAYTKALVEAFFLRVLAELNRKPSDVIEPEVPLISDAIKYLRIHLRGSKLTVREVAGALGCTPDHLSRQFHRTEGMKLMTWLAHERVALAKHLLTETKHNVAEVGWASGFNEPSYFIRIFKRYTGLTPRAYRAGFPAAHDPL